MRANYQRLGDYIRPVDVRNKELKVSSPMGVNIGKFFMPSVANTIGTDLSKYKLVAQWQFACNLMHVGRDEALPIACNESEIDLLVSPAYHVFEIVNTKILMPEFLTLLFKRSVFDREAWFYTDGDVRQGLPVSSLYNMKLPVPSIEEQRRIVAQYQAAEIRIRNNERLIAHLEDTAQAIFHHRFVENIDPNNLPKGWKIGHIDDIAILKVGGDKPKVFSRVPTRDCEIPIYSNGIDQKGLYGFTDKPSIREKSVTISARGTIGYCFLRYYPYFSIVRLISAIPKEYHSLYYLFFALKNKNLTGDGSVQNQLTVPFLLTEDFIIPTAKELELFYSEVHGLYSYLTIIEKELDLLRGLQSMIISKLV